MLYGRKPFGHGIPQAQIYDKGVILRAFKVEFPSETPKKYRVSEAAKEFISGCLKYQVEDRFSPSDAYEHAYLRR
jgi:tousled-like kinase